MEGRNIKATWYLFDLKVILPTRWLIGLRRSLVHLLMIARHCVLRQGSNSGQGGEGFNFLAGMVSIWQRDVKLQQTQYIPDILIDNDNLMDVDEDFDEDTDESSSELVDNDPYINDTEYDDDDDN